MKTGPDDELDREIRTHLELEEEERIADGLPPDAARYAARRMFGNVTHVKEVCRDLRRVIWLDHLVQDVRFAGRQIRRAPGFAAAAITTLALGIGVNTIVFTLLNSLALRPMPIHDPAHVVRIIPIDEHGRRQNLFSYLDYVDYRDQSEVFDGLVGYVPVTLTIAESPGPGGGGPEEILAYAVSANYFSVLGITPALGRAFLPLQDETPGAGTEIVISHPFWEQHFSSDPSVLGRTLTLNSHPFTVVGVAPRDFFGTEPFMPDIWVPLTMQQQIEPGRNLLHDRRAGWLLLIGRLGAGTSSRAAAAMNLVARRLAAAYPAPNRTAGIEFAPATFFTLDPRVKPIVALVMAIVGLVLLVACANVANLTLARATSRQREIAVRLALGASRWRLVRQLLTESVLVAMLGGAAGLLLSFWTLRFLYPIGVSLVPFRWGTVVLDLQPDLTVFGYTLLLAMGAGLAFGLAPALGASRPNLSAAMHEEGAMLGVTWSRSHLRNALVAVQIAVSLVLLIGAGLLTRGLQRARALDLGFETHGVIFTSYELTRHGYRAADVAEFNRRLAERARQLPGVTSVGLTSHVPLTGGIRRTTVRLDGEEPQPGFTPASCRYTTVSPAYFNTLGMRVVKGRTFTPEETTTDQPVVIVSEALARRFWPNQDPLGRRFQTTLSSAALTVVGIVRDSSDASLWREKEISLYFPLRLTSDQSRVHVLVRTTADPSTVISALRDEARALDANVKFDAKPIDDVLRLWILPSQVAAIGATVLGMVALLLASVGIYSVIAYVVSHRTREIGVRMALGADSRVVLRLVLVEGMQLVLLGVALGLISSVATTRVLRGVLFDLSALDPLTFVSVPSLLSLVALAACYVPARRATKVGPMVALRCD